MAYGFAYGKRVTLTRALKAPVPDPAGCQVFILTTGSEGIENSIKLSKTYALEKYRPRKKFFISFCSALHGRTLGAHLASGQSKLKRWIIDEGKTFTQALFADGYLNTDTSFNTFTRSLQAQGIVPADIAGVLNESYQGGGANFFCPIHMRAALESFYREYDIVTICDEVQAGFGGQARCSLTSITG